MTNSIDSASSQGRTTEAPQPPVGVKVKPGDCVHCGKEICNDHGWCNSFKPAPAAPCGCDRKAAAWGVIRPTSFHYEGCALRGNAGQRGGNRSGLSRAEGRENTGSEVKRG